jgi:D-alanyl-D-alanine carboxypeptidase
MIHRLFLSMRSDPSPAASTGYSWPIAACWLSCWLLACQSAPTAAEPAPAAIAVSDTNVIAQEALPTDTAVDLDYLFGKFEPARQPNFVKVEKPYTDRPNMYLRREAYEAFKNMHAAAKKDGVTLRIISSTRTFAQQTAIWNGKWTRFAKEAPAPADRARKILEYSAMPGASRHHWGTDIDLNDLNNPAFAKGGAHAAVYTWLLAHAHEYGYCQPYTAGRPYGYNEERWHWSYTPLARPLLAQYRRQVTDAMLQGFNGAETAREIAVVKHYALGINESCQ